MNRPPQDMQETAIDHELGFGLYGQLDQAAAATITLGCGGKTIVITVDATSEEATIGPVL